MFKDALKQALGEGSGLQAREQPQAPAPSAGLPGPEGSPWLQELSRHAELPRDASLGRLRQETDLQVKRLKQAGRARDAKALAKARDSFLKRRESAAWSAVKSRWTELGLSEKAYRRLKQDKRVQAEKVLQRLHTRKADEMKGRGAQALVEWLT